MSQFTETVISCILTPKDVRKPFVASTNQNPAGWKATDMAFRFLMMDDKNPAEPYDMTNATQVFVQVKAKDSPASAPLMLKSLTAAEINDAVTVAEWNAGTGQHVYVSFTYAETALTPGDYDLTVWGYTTDGRVVYGTSTFTIRDAGIDNTVAVAPAIPTWEEVMNAKIAGCVKYGLNPAGATLILQSQNNGHTFEQTIADDGTPGVNTN